MFDPPCNPTPNTVEKCIPEGLVVRERIALSIKSNNTRDIELAKHKKVLNFCMDFTNYWTYLESFSKSLSVGG